MPPLTNKQRAFVAHYVLCHFDPIEAAERAGYVDPERTGPANLEKPHVQAAIDTHVAQLQMSADEVLWRLTEQARASLADYLALDADGAPRWDLRRGLEQHGLIPVKKLKISQTSKGQQIDLELHDAQAALKLLGTHYQLFNARSKDNTRDESATQAAARERVLAKVALLLGVGAVD